MRRFRQLPRLKRPTQERTRKMDTVTELSNHQESHTRITLNRTIVKDLLGLNTVHEIQEAEELLDEDPEALAEILEERRRSINNCSVWLQNHVKPLSPIARETSRVTIKVIQAPRESPHSKQSTPKLRMNSSFSVLPSIRQKYPLGQGPMDIRDYDQDLEEEADRMNAPQRPRFCATLSAEAQFAMMQGYDDLLRNRFDDNVTRSTSRLSTVENPSPSPANSRLTTPRGERVKLTSAKDEQGRGLPTEKRQLGVTKTFQNAMDILDTLKGIQGENVTSPRDLKRFHNPVNKYRNWTRDWSRDFQVVRTSKT